MKNISADFCSWSTNLLRCWACFFACCLFGGCTVSAESQSPLEYYMWVKAAPKSGLQAELDKLETNLSSYSLISAVRASTILITSALADSKTEQAALPLLTRATSLEAKTDDDMAYKIFADVLQAIAQQRLDLQSARTTNHKALTEIDALKNRNTELEQQIEELTSIERQIIEREKLNELEP
jgi:putative IMPACT (imprinted ancient) family translation regulator